MDDGVAFNICERDTTFYWDLHTTYTNLLDSSHLTDGLVTLKCDT